MKVRVPIDRGFPAGPFPRGSTAERGVALIVTLILLSVITFMAIAFLVLSRAERGAVSTSTDQMVARAGADHALAVANARLLAPMRAFNNPYSYGLIVSTNFMNGAGFYPGLKHPTNVNFDFRYTGGPLSQADFLENLTNSMFDPRPPVFADRRGNGTNLTEFRYYLDLNRNTRYDTNGSLPVISPVGGFYDTNGIMLPPGNPPVPVLSNYFVGDPEWIGGLEFPDRPHGPNNHYLYRYAYAVIPAGNTLDLNAIHNYVKGPDASLNAQQGDGFLRNQGVGPWEINLGAFLVDLNTNLWGADPSYYRYGWQENANPGFTDPNQGVAFDDALSLLRYRYGANQGSLAPVSLLFGPGGLQAFQYDQYDGYSAGPVMTNTWWPNNRSLPDHDFSRVTLPWAGSDNPQRLFTPQDLFDRVKAGTFTDRLLSAGFAPDSYNRYTYYRMLAQLGTDSEPESRGKMNLNYDNLVQYNPLGVASATNFYQWVPIDFFTNAANRLLKNAGYTNTIDRIPVRIYTPSLHRLLQMAANLYDATRIDLDENRARHPTAFRPHFVVDPTDGVCISGYSVVLNHTPYVTGGAGGVRIVDLLEGQTPNPNDLVYGIPLVLGARKGTPNFNEFAMETKVDISRLLEFRRNSINGPVVETNQMYVVGISNTFGMEAWNSYSNVFSSNIAGNEQNLELTAVSIMSAFMTNESGVLLFTNTSVRSTITNFTGWKGWTNFNEIAQSFVIPFQPTDYSNRFAFLPPVSYDQAALRFIPQTHIFQRNQGFPVPRWWLTVRTKVRFILSNGNGIVDYVNLSHPGEVIDIFAKLSEDGNCGTITPDTFNQPGSLWCTNRIGGATALTAPTYGIVNQIMACLNGPANVQSFSLDPTVGRDTESAIDFFRWNLKEWGPKYAKNIGKTFYKSNIFFAPLSPYRPIYVHTKWEANDPLVHYTIGDLLDYMQQRTNNVSFTTIPPENNIGKVNTRYQPWGGRPAGSSNPTVPDKELKAKDPLVSRSDDWDFPTNKLPNVGWIGRVHRGTPWQTVYLKPDRIGIGNLQTPGQWEMWTGNGMAIQNFGQIDTNIVAYGALTNDASFSHPIQDHKMVELFTTALSDNASRGRLSINQTNLAAWSAALSGVNVMPDVTTNTVIQPAGVYDPTIPPPLVRFVEGLNATRATNFSGSFRRLGDILKVPEMTIRSPWLTGNTNIIGDAVYERIPQQVLGLLHCDETPRFVVYSFGQALKPAKDSVLTSGQYRGMVTNYQVVAESATRAVVRVEDPNGNPRVVVESFNPLPPD